jgi:hypothetical protein
MATPAVRLQEVLQTTGEALIEVQRKLSAKQIAIAGDPWLGHESADDLAALTAERDALLRRWSHAGLAWLVRGGTVELRDPTGEEAASLSGPVQPVPVPSAVVPRHPVPAPNTAGLRGAGIGPTWTRGVQSRPPTPVAQPEDLPAILASLEEHPKEMDTAESLTAELVRLTGAINSSMTALWLRQPKELQQALVGHVTARARQVQDRLRQGAPDEPRVPDLDRVFSAMTAFSKKEQPGFVFGLMRTHTPVHGSWDADARAWWVRLVQHTDRPASSNPEKSLTELERRITESEGDDAVIEQTLETLEAGVEPDDRRLLSLISPHLDLLKKHARFKKLRKAIREAADQDAEFEAELAEPAPSIAEDWPFWHLVRGKRATIIGGDLREDARKRIKDAFGFTDLDWVTTDHARNVQVLASAVEGGSIEFVILLRRFIGHDVDRIVIPACKTADVPWVSVDRGYGVTQIAQSIERFRATDAVGQ